MSSFDFAAAFSVAPVAALGSHPKHAAGLALSGGGFRAMLFHVGSLKRLSEVGALTQFDRISSVSGGSITAALLALRWEELVSAERTFEELIQEPLVEFANAKIDWRAVAAGAVHPRKSSSDYLSRRLARLLGDGGLGQLPDEPRFVFCATNLGTGSLIRFAKPYSADRRVGMRTSLDLPMSRVVAASAAFPPFLSPARISLSPDDSLTEQFPGDDPELSDTSFARNLVLSDGGVYDNLGMQPLEQLSTVLVSDGGGSFQYAPTVPTNWLLQMIRAWKVTDNQVRSLRKSQLVSALQTGRRNGAYWGISTRYSDYAGSLIPVHDTWAEYLKQVPTRLAPIPIETRHQIINFSYCLTDAAIRTHVLPVHSHLDPSIPAAALPYPEAPLSQAAPVDR